MKQQKENSGIVILQSSTLNHMGEKGSFFHIINDIAQYHTKNTQLRIIRIHSTSIEVFFSIFFFLQ
jgi:hypothetical protein